MLCWHPQRWLLQPHECNESNSDIEEEVIVIEGSTIMVPRGRGNLAAVGPPGIRAAATCFVRPTQGVMISKLSLKGKRALARVPLLKQYSSLSLWHNTIRVQSETQHNYDPPKRALTQSQK